MWSPKTPLKLPGKKPFSKYELINLEYLLGQDQEDLTFNVDDAQQLNSTNETNREITAVDSPTTSFDNLSYSNASNNEQ